MFSAVKREVFETNCNASAHEHRLIGFDWVCMLNSPPSPEVCAFSVLTYVPACERHSYQNTHFCQRRDELTELNTM